MSINQIIIDGYSNMRHAGVDNYPSHEKRLNNLWERAAFGDDAEREKARAEIRRIDGGVRNAVV